VRTLWLTLDEVRASAARHRSPLVLRCMEDHAAGRRHALDTVFTHPSLWPRRGRCRERPFRGLAQLLHGGDCSYRRAACRPDLGRAPTPSLRGAHPMKHALSRLTMASALAAGALVALPAHAGKTLDAIKARGQLICGVNTGLAGFSAADSQGNWTGLDVDVCKAIAATMLNDASKVKYVPLNAQQRFTALQSGEIDMLSRNTTWTLTRDASLGLHFTGVTYYDGQGFMVPAKKSKIKSAKQLKGATVCVQSAPPPRRT
jgi:hypothetical protein